LSVADIRWQIVAERLEIAQLSHGQRRPIENRHRCFQWYMIEYDPLHVWF